MFNYKRDGNNRKAVSIMSKNVNGKYLVTLTRKTMITESGYSKDLSIIPEGIAVTLGSQMIEEKCGSGKQGLLSFLRWFESCLNDDGAFFLKLKNKPTRDILYVYVIVCNRLYCRCLYAGHQRSFEGYTSPDSETIEETNWSGILVAGPIKKPKFKRELKGFQGFRYTTKLF